MPSTPSSPTLSERGAIQEPDEKRKVEPSRTASYLSLNSHLSFPLEPGTPSIPVVKPDMLVKDDDNVWHNPSIKQMVESLQVNLMTRGALSPIPVEYNSYVLHLIEAFQGMQAKIDAADSARDDEVRHRARVEQDLADVAEEWEKREAEYNAEVKRLEVIIARTSRDGLETVTLARANSVIDREGPDPRQFVAKLQLLRDEETCPSRPGSPQDLDGANEYDAFLGRAHSTRINTLNTLLRHSRQSDRAAVHVGSGRLGTFTTFDIHSLWIFIDGQANLFIARLPSIIDKERDFIASQRFIDNDQRVSCQARDSVESPDQCSDPCPESKAEEGHPARSNPQDSPQSRASMIKYHEFESTSSSSDSDEDSQDVTAAHSRHLNWHANDATCEPGIIAVRSRWSPATRSEANRRGSTQRFSFIAGDDDALSSTGYQATSARHGQEFGELGRRDAIRLQQNAHPRTEPSPLQQLDESSF